MRLPVSAIILIGTVVCAQPPVAPTNEPTENNRGENKSGYNFLQSWELGYRWDTVGGDLGMYRSTVNYGNGIRLLSSSLSVQSLEGHGHLFDQLLLNTQGLGNDPYQSATLRIEKNRLYRYDLLWRSDAYYNPGLTVSYGEHFMDTVRHLQDQDLTLFPQSNFKIFAGYSRVSQDGPALSTINLFDASRGDEFPLFADIRRQQNEYRLGGEAQFLGFRLNVLRGWEGFKEDTVRSLTSPSAGNNPNDLTQLNSFRGAEPYHGSSPYWRVALFREGKKYWAMNGRFTYVAGQRGFVLDENAAGLDRIGSATTRQVLTYGNAQRPAATGNLTFSIFPGSRVTLTNQTSIYNIRMMGDSYFEQFTNGSSITPLIFFNYLGIRTIANTTDLQVHLLPWFSVHGGYTYDDRRISLVEKATQITSPFGETTPTDQTNRLNAGTIGFRIKPVRAVTVNLDAEIGRADKPIYPISERDYHALRGRIEYRRGPIRLSAYARTDYNTNSVSLTSFASHSRQYGVDASWTPSTRFAIDAGYSKLHLDTLGGLVYFVARNQLISGDQSYYASNIHTASLMSRFTVARRADISVGYSHVQDLGDGRATPGHGPGYTTQPAFLAAQTFPLRFLSPQARFSLRLTQRVRWNTGYQYYGYREDFATLQNYRAHTGYSSVSWSF